VYVNSHEIDRITITVNYDDFEKTTLNFNNITMSS